MNWWIWNDFLTHGLVDRNVFFDLKIGESTMYFLTYKLVDVEYIF